MPFGIHSATARRLLASAPPLFLRSSFPCSSFCPSPPLLSCRLSSTLLVPSAPSRTRLLLSSSTYPARGSLVFQGTPGQGGLAWFRAGAAMASKACAEGFPWEGQPKGSEITLGSFPTYVARPAGDAKSPHGAILFINDVFGWQANNNRIASDFLADASGLPVYLPDFFGADVFTAETRLEFLAKHDVGLTQPKLEEILGALRPLHRGDKAKVGAIGFCWGGRYSLRLGAQGQLAASVACHPSRVSPLDDSLASTSAPTLLLLAQGDPIFSGELRQQTEDSIKGSGAPLEAHEYEGVKHGFTVRCDPSDPVAVKARDDAQDKAAAWFAKYLV